LSRSNSHRMHGLLIEVVCGSNMHAKTFSSTFFHRIFMSETESNSLMVTVDVSDPGELLTFATLDRILRDAMRAAESRGRAAESVIVKLIIRACIERAWRGVPVRGLSGSAAMMKALNDRIGQASPRDKLCGQPDRPWSSDRRIMTGSTLMVIVSLRDLFPTSVILRVDDDCPLHPDRPVTTMDPAGRKEASAFIGKFRNAIVAPRNPIAELVSGSPSFNGAAWDVDRFGQYLVRFDEVMTPCIPRYIGFGRLIGRAAAITDDSVEGEIIQSPDSRSKSFADFISDAKRRKTTPSPKQPTDESERITASCETSKFVPFKNHKEPEAPSLSQSFRKDYSATPPLFDDDE
jgi:hypothetical protein